MDLGIRDFRIKAMIIRINIVIVMIRVTVTTGNWVFSSDLTLLISGFELDELDLVDILDVKVETDKGLVLVKIYEGITDADKENDEYLVVNVKYPSDLTF